MLKIPYEELSMAFDFVSFDGVGTHAAYISLETGRIYWISEDSQADEEVPEDIEDSDRYFLVPHKRDLDLGTHLVLRFAAQEWPEQLETIQAFFRRPGGYARFKSLLADAGRVEEWYRFEADATDQALREWCAEHGIELVRA